MSCGQYSTREINITIFFLYLFSEFLYFYIFFVVRIVNGQFFYESIKESENVIKKK